MGALQKEIARNGIDDINNMQKSYSVCLDASMVRNLLDHNGGMRNLNPNRERADTDDFRPSNLSAPAYIAPKTYVDNR